VHDLVDANVYPTPAFPVINRRRLLEVFTFPMVCIGFQLLAFVSLAYKKNWKIPYEAKFVLQLLFLVLALFFYRGVLGRSDVLHVMQAGSFAILGCAIVLASYLSTFPLLTRKLLALPLLIWACTFLWSHASSPLSIVNDVASFKARALVYANKPDDEFLPPQMKATKYFLAEEFANQKCLSSLVAEPLWNYLLRKPSCDRFYISWFISPPYLQNEALDNLKTQQPEKILLHTPKGGDSLDLITLDVRVPKLYGYIMANYELSKAQDGWIVYKRKKK
jgi:hypothetical protein